MALRIAVLANLKENAPILPGMAPDTWAELDTQRTTDAIVAALEMAGHRAVVLEGDVSLAEQLHSLAPDICFNLCEGHWGDSRESHVPAILEMLRIPYTGSGVLALAVTLDKPLTKRLLAHHGLPTPAFQVFHRADAPVHPDLRYPLFVKPSREGSSLGVTAASIVDSERELRDQVAQQLERFQQPILVERFVRGREVTVGIVGNLAGEEFGDEPDGTAPGAPPPDLRVLPPLEVHVERYPEGRSGVYVGRIKSDPGDEYYYSCPALLPPALIAELRSIAAKAFAVTGCRDVARVDFRLDTDDGDRPYVLEVNGLPGLSPGYSDLVLAAEAAGTSYRELITSIVDHACARHGLTRPRAGLTMEVQDAGECGPFRIIIAADGSRALHACRALAPGDLLGTFSIAELVPRPTRYSIQLGASEHALVEPEVFRLINHSCVPNLALDASGLALRAVRPIEPGEELTYFYPSTEWQMAEPFTCHCGEPRCLGWIAGAAHLPVETLTRYDLADHISLLLEQRRGKPAAPGVAVKRGHGHA